MPSLTIDNNMLGLPIAITMGDPRGIGLEIIFKSFLKAKDHKLSPFFIVGDYQGIETYLNRMGFDILLVKVKDTDKVTELFNEGQLPILDIECSHQSTAYQVMHSIEIAVELVQNLKASSMVTAPIHKSYLYDEGFEFPGHTEYLAHLCSVHTGKEYDPVMLLASDELKVVPLTVHMALVDIFPAITQDKIITMSESILKDFKVDFALTQPRLAIAGLNPHAGENGALGREEIETIIPAIETLKAKGYDVAGPYSADTLFHSHARATYDVALCMYHDQALIPIKTIAFDEGVNITLNLPIIRTSPDHGTALNIAFQNKANEQSMINSIKYAALLSRNRCNNKAKEDV